MRTPLPSRWLKCSLKLWLRLNLLVSARVPDCCSKLTIDATVAGKKRGRVPKEGKKVKDPNAPKRPATSYIMFQNDVREDLRQKNPGLPYKGKLKSFVVCPSTHLSPLELLGKVSEAWQALADDQKKQYQDAADVNMAKYNRAVLDYKGAVNGHPPVVSPYFTCSCSFDRASSFDIQGCRCADA